MNIRLARDTAPLRWLILIPILGAILLTAQPGGAKGSKPAASTSAGATISIVNGQQTSINEWPWQVAIAHRGNQNPRKRTFCGGVLIAPTVVATAGHCVIDPSDPRVEPADRLEVITGRTVLNSSAGEVANVAEVIVPKAPWGLRFDRGWDAALLRVATPVSSTPIKLAGDDEAGSWAPGQVAWTTGWGSRFPNDRGGSPRLRVTRQVMLPDRVCRDAWRRDFRADVMNCLGSPAGNSGACMGDSGGPLVVKVGSEYRLVGLTSFGEERCALYAPRVDARVAAQPMRGWIETTVRNTTGDEVVGSGGEISPTPVWCRIPHLRGLTVRQARKRLRRNRCRLGKVKRIRTRGVRRKHVFDSYLPAGWLAPVGFRQRIAIRK